MVNLEMLRSLPLLHMTLTMASIEEHVCVCVLYKRIQSIVDRALPYLIHSNLFFLFNGCSCSRLGRPRRQSHLHNQVSIASKQVP
jgi:hypothetical protein